VVPKTLVWLTNNFLDNSDILSEYDPMKPLPIPIPLDLADVLDTDPSNICHMNAGRRPVPYFTAIRIMELAKYDSRLTKLELTDLRPEQELARPYLCPKKIGRKRAGR
jgi:hypothetical protein